jgi:tetratricopeptide (TPR) repeat protein
MKKIIVVLLAIAFVSPLFAASKKPLTGEELGDKYYAERNSVTDTAKAAENIDKAIQCYETALKAGESERLYYKLALASEFKYGYLVSGENIHQQRWDAYKALVDRLEKFCEGNTLCAGSKYMAYSRAIMWGRFGELMNPLEAASSGLAGKIRDYSESLLALDPAFNGYAAYALLGRMHCKAPNIPFVLAWPDKNKSKEYLEEYYRHNPDTADAKYFLADTLWDLDLKDRAKELYLQVIKSRPRPGDYFEDINTIEECAARVKELGL